jgi:hypothetical protein
MLVLEIVWSNSPCGGLAVPKPSMNLSVEVKQTHQLPKVWLTILFISSLLKCVSHTYVGPLCYVKDTISRVHGTGYLRYQDLTLTYNCNVYVTDAAFFFQKDMNLANFVAQCPSWNDTNRYYQEISRPKFHYHIHRRPTLIPILSQINPVHTLPPYTIKVNFSIISCTLTSPKRFI